MDHHVDAMEKQGVGTCLYILGGIAIIGMIAVCTWIVGMIYFLFFSRYHIIGICMAALPLLMIFGFVRRRLTTLDGFDPSL